MWCICNYVNGKINGEYKDYYSNGQLFDISNYIDGKMKCIKYHKNGNLYVICNYVDEKLSGEYKEYSDDGIITSHVIYENNEIIQTIL